MNETPGCRQRNLLDRNSTGKSKSPVSKSRTSKMETQGRLLFSQTQARKRESARQSHDPSIEALKRVMVRFVLPVPDREKTFAKRKRDATGPLHEVSWESHDAASLLFHVSFHFELVADSPAFFVPVAVLPAKAFSKLRHKSPGNLLRKQRCISFCKLFCILLLLLVLKSISSLFCREVLLYWNYE